VTAGKLRDLVKSNFCGGMEIPEGVKNRRPTTISAAWDDAIFLKIDKASLCL